MSDKYAEIAYRIARECRDDCGETFLEHVCADILRESFPDPKPASIQSSDGISLFSLLDSLDAKITSADIDRINEWIKSDRAAQRQAGREEALRENKHRGESSDEEENIHDNPRSWIAWKRYSEEQVKRYAALEEAARAYIKICNDNSKEAHLARNYIDLNIARDGMRKTLADLEVK